MADYKIFVVGSSNDYTQYVNTDDYVCNKEDVMETWTDANHINRAHVLRTRLSGSIHMVLETSLYNTFLGHWANAKNADGTYNIKVHPNTTDTSTEDVSCKAFCTMVTKVVYGTSFYSYRPVAMDIQIEFEEA